MLLDLKDVYWARQGRLSVDVGIGGISAAASYFAALPVLRRMREKYGRRRLTRTFTPGKAGYRGGLPHCGGSGVENDAKTSAMR